MYGFPLCSVWIRVPSGIPYYRYTVKSDTTFLGLPFKYTPKYQYTRKQPEIPVFRNTVYTGRNGINYSYTVGNPSLDFHCDETRLSGPLHLTLPSSLLVTTRYRKKIPKFFTIYTIFFFK